MNEANYIGCFAYESSFGDRVYVGGATGANFTLALNHAKTIRKRYFALARNAVDGHSFAFSSLEYSKGMMQGGGCEKPCADVKEKVCGCMDDTCSGPIPRGEENNRRWAVYEVIKSGS